MAWALYGMSTNIAFAFFTIRYDIMRNWKKQGRHFPKTLVGGGSSPCAYQPRTLCLRRLSGREGCGGIPWENDARPSDRKNCTSKANPKDDSYWMNWGFIGMEMRIWGGCAYRMLQRFIPNCTIEI